MSFKNWSVIVCLLPLAVATSAALSAERHNIVLLVPTALPAAAVNEVTAPTLSRLKSEGVYFSNSYSGFPRLVRSGPDAKTAHMDMLAVLAAATATHSTALVDGTTPDSEPALPETDLSDSGSSLDMILEVTLPRFKEKQRPFVLVYRFEPESEGSQRLPLRQFARDDESPLVNAAITADHALAAIEGKLRHLELHETTNIIVAAEQGISLVWKAGKQNGRINLAAEQARWGTLPPGFLAMDLAVALAEENRALKLFDPDNDFAPMKHAAVRHPRFGNGVIAVTPDEPLIVIEARGDHDVIYLAPKLPGGVAKRLARDIVKAVFQFSYTSGVFVNEIRTGRPRGTLPLSHIGWSSTLDAPLPDIVVTFASVGLPCGEATLCTHAIADTILREGQVLQGSFSRADTWNFIAARGPDFRSRLNSVVPASNADVVRTVRELLRLSSRVADGASARVLVESLRHSDATPPPVRRWEIVSSETSDGLSTEVHLQAVGATRYFHAAGGPGWTVGIPLRPASLEWRPWRGIGLGSEG